MTGNKGEWSELYTLFKLASEGRLYAADENMDKIHSIYYDILKIIRNQKDDNFEYIRNGNIKIVSETSGEVINTVNIQEFEENAQKLLLAIKEKHSSKGSFEVPEISYFTDKVKCTATKAKSTEKADITLMVHDSWTASQPTLGFSIKSQLGGPSTLFNASGATNFIYKLQGHKLSENEKTEFHSYKFYRDKFKYLDSIGTSISFVKVENEIFNSNLMLVDTQMPMIIACMLEAFFRGKASRITDLVNLCSNMNICHVNEENKEIFYTYKIKELLTNIALGMLPATTWDGYYDATGGYIIVKEDGDILCYHIYNRNAFREYLFKNTKFDTPSKSKHGFGVIETLDKEQVLKLGLQIRFLK